MDRLAVRHPHATLQRVEHYDLLDEIGHGGMATVYQAWDTRLHRDVALKILHEHIAGRAENRARFEREARAVAKVRHRNIIAIYGFSSPAAEVGYIATELIEGPTLRKFVEDVGFEHPDVAAMVALVLGEALSHAHEEGVIHRDVKPENVMIDAAGVPKLMDFGLARLLDAQKVTVTGSLMGSPAHMAPEIIEGQEADQRADIFALGTVLYFLVTRALPFDGSNPAVVLNAILSGKFAPAASRNPRVSSRLDRIISKAMARDLDERYQTADELVGALRDYLKELELERPTEELAKFFRDPRAYNELLRRRLTARLLEIAHESADAGRIGVAVNACDRVLVLDPGSHDALELLTKLRVSRRRKEALWIVVALFVLVGVAAALIWSQARSHSTDGLAAPAFIDARETVREASVAVERALNQTALPLGVAVGLELVAVAQNDAHDYADADVAWAYAGIVLRSSVDVADVRAENQRVVDYLRTVQADQERIDDPERVGVIPPIDRQPPLETYRVSITVTPLVANVTIDGRSYGRTALNNLRLAAGTYRVTARHPVTDMFITREIVVLGDVDGEQGPFALVVPWPPATLSFRTRGGGGTVIIDDVRRGSTDESYEVEVGIDGNTSVRVRVIASEVGPAPYEQIITLRQGDNRMIELQF